MPLHPDTRRAIDQIRDDLFGGGCPDPRPSLPSQQNLGQHVGRAESILKPQADALAKAQAAFGVLLSKIFHREDSWPCGSSPATGW